MSATDPRLLWRFMYMHLKVLVFTLLENGIVYYATTYNLENISI